MRVWDQQKYLDGLKDKLVKKVTSADKVKAYLFSRYCTRAEIEDENSPSRKKLEGDIEKTVDGLFSKLEGSDELWQYDDIQCMSGTWGYVIIRDGEVINNEVIGRS